MEALNTDHTLYIVGNFSEKSSSILVATTTATTTISTMSDLFDITNSTNIPNSSIPIDSPSLSTHKIDWTDLVLALLLCLLIVITVIGNTLVILSVLTTRRLRTVTNCFVMSLAVADWLVGIFVMPPAVALMLVGSWQLGWVFCNIWISLDVLLCTASILSLCAISIDRYLAVTQPLNYSRRRRSKRLALLMILIVWVVALAITCPPILGWYDHRRAEKHDECGYNQNEGYVVFSAMGSFFIPMAVMVYVYARISCVVAARHDHMTEIEVHKRHNKHFDVEAEQDVDLEPSSEQDLQSPYRKKQHSFRQTSRSNISMDLKESRMEFNVMGGKNIQHLQERQSQHQQQQQDKPQTNNGHYDQDDFSIRSTSQKRTKPKSNNASSTMSDHWSKLAQPVQYSVKQNNTVLYELQRQQQHTSTIKQNTRIHHKSLSNRILSLKRENKTTQTLSIVVGGFIVCWLPFFVCYLIAPFVPVSKTLSTMLTWLGWLNSAMNPFIYAFYSVDFRAAFWRLTFRRFFESSTKAPYPSNAMSIKR
ncbi:probable G-protein coupled receptor No18 [Contarinia nasturtii]|uniref:probable G-protein coupled receptor No18 n=1 Tax=Contarinia nasturtii TaxID=265458 RepID=UPI0012D4BA5D|nr:probable G-protein coupled receptor No18 [Contarinia nasturtii]XP_031631548.1 probable G-protein coupled receptor No18 [Contarinia nasturtii]